MFLSPSSAFAESVMTTITCATPDGQSREFQVGWDNSNQFFADRGEIPRLYCEGGYAGAYTIYVSDLLALDDPRRWFNGIVPVVEPTLEPTPEPTPVVTQTPEPEPTQSVVPTLNPEPTPEPSQSESPSIEPMPEPTPSPEPSVTPTPEPTPTPSPSQSQVAPVPVVEPSPIASDLVPDLVPTAEPEVVQELVQESEQIVVLEVPSALENIIGVAQVFAAAEAFMNVGSDMTDEQREESQSVVVAAVLVGQLAMRKIK